jgi:hypothetical protein
MFWARNCFRPSNVAAAIEKFLVPHLQPVPQDQESYNLSSRVFWVSSISCIIRISKNGIIRNLLEKVAKGLQLHENGLTVFIDPNYLRR